MAVRCPKCLFENPPGSDLCGRCAATLPPPADKDRATKTFQTAVLRELATGTTFAGRYQVIEELGKGGMGRVYKVLDEKIKEKVALKLLKPEISADEEAIERFSNELRLARKISHRHVCRMFDLGEDQGTHYITMEYVPGEDLKSILRMMGQMSAAKAVLVGRQVCEGLAEAHRLGIVHRDLKPQNIMIDREGSVRIMDFGIARSLKVKGMTGAGVVIGTPEYMSPEQIEGQEVDHRSDIYSFGIILYEMMSGRVPFEGESFLSIAVRQKTEKPRSPRDFNPQIPGDIVRLILRCLEKDRAMRFQSAEEVLAELGRIEKGLPTTEKVLPSVKPSTAHEITVKFTPRRLAIPAAAFVVLIVAAIVGVRLLKHKGLVPAPSGKPSLAVMYFENDTGDPGLDHWRKALPTLLVTDLSQSKYVNVLTSDELFDVLNRLGQLDAKSYSSKALKEIAARGGVNHILLGQLTKAGDSFRLSYTLKKFGSGETVGSGWVAGEGFASFYPMVDALTRKVKENLKLTRAEIAGDIDVELGRITTTSPEALLLYTQGREYHHKTENAKSIELMQKAVAIDPGFAMAYRSIFVSYSNSYMPAEAIKWLEKAMAVRDRVSDKERLLLEAEYYSLSEQTDPKAIETYQKLLGIYPDDTFANTKLAFLYMGYELWDKVIEHGQAAIRNRDRTYYPYNYLASAYLALGQLEKAKEAAELGILSIGENASLRMNSAEYYLYRRKFEEALKEIDKAIGLSPDAPLYRMVRGNLLLYQGDLAGATAEFQEILKSKDPGARAFYVYEMIALAVLQGKFIEALNLSGQVIRALEKMGEIASANAYRLGSAYILIRLGRLQEAGRECDRVLKDATEIAKWGLQRKALRAQGLIFAASNAEADARHAAGELAALIRQSLNPNEISKVDVVIGAIELQKGNWGAAIEHLKKAAGRLPHEYSFPDDEHAIYFEPLALAYYNSGDLEKARGEYQKITVLTTGRFFCGDIYARSFYMLGRIAEQLGEKAAAREQYQKFLDLWKDADPGLPEFADAKARLAGL